MSFYKYWRLLDELPRGWKVCKAAGSPLHGYEFCTNSLSAIHPNHQRALVRIQRPEGVQVVVAVNQAAREAFKLKLLRGIRVDMMICELEGGALLSI